MAFFMWKIVIFVAEMVLIAAEWRLWTRMACSGASDALHDGNGAFRRENERRFLVPVPPRWRIGWLFLGNHILKRR